MCFVNAEDCTSVFFIYLDPVENCKDPHVILSVVEKVGEFLVDNQNCCVEIEKQITL